MVCPATDNAPSFEICAVIHFFLAKNMSGAEIRCELYVVYSQNVVNEGTVRQWCRIFKDG
jgi:hypothetical protein